MYHNRKYKFLKYVITDTQASIEDIGEDLRTNSRAWPHRKKIAPMKVMISDDDDPEIGNDTDLDEKKTVVSSRAEKYQVANKA